MSSSTLQPPAVEGTPARRRPVPGERRDRMAWPVFGLAATISAGLALYWGRGLTYSADEIVQVMASPTLDLDGALDPYNGHFVFFSRLIYKGGLELFGSDYLTFRLLTVASLILTAALVFIYAARRIGRTAALAPAFLVLFFGSDFGHILQGAGFTILLALACGVGALLALERRDVVGDVIACILLSLGVATYSVALGFLFGAIVAVLLGDDRWRRIWVVAIPFAIYAAWWLHARGASGDPQGQVSYSNILLLPAWSYQSLSAVLGSASGLDYSFSESSLTTRAGPVLALIAVIAVARVMWSGAITRPFWAATASLGALWAIGVLAASSVRQPGADRYLFPVLVAVILVGTAAAAGCRWTRNGLIALTAITLVGLASNVIQLRDGGDQLRDAAATIKLPLGVLDVAGDRADPNFDPPEGVGTLLQLSFDIVDRLGQSPVEQYLAASERYGGFGYSLDELHALGEPDRARADRLLVGALGVVLEPGAEATGSCRVLRAAGGQGSFVLQPGEAVVIAPQQGSDDVAIRRFADPTAAELGKVSDDRPAALEVPVDTAPDPWVVAVTGPPAKVCVP